jgi:bifunctional DNA-binding transcriptional regulator/antitoxin component of YhaV-PrlF toxin-antitoxin module
VLPVKFESSVMQVGTSLRITIPQELSKYLDLGRGDIVELWTNNHSIILEKKKLTFDAVWGFQEDILKLRKSLGKTLRAHTSQPVGRPLHRYEGRLSITRNDLILEGEDAETKQDAAFLFSRHDVTEIHFGWDDTLRRWKDTRAYIRPLRITFENDTDSRTVYLYAKNPGAVIYGEENQRIRRILQKQ